jgi:hypothetical protein
MTRWRIVRGGVSTTLQNNLECDASLRRHSLTTAPVATALAARKAAILLARSRACSSGAANQRRAIAVHERALGAGSPILLRAK